MLRTPASRASAARARSAHIAQRQNKSGDIEHGMASSTGWRHKIYEHNNVTISARSYAVAISLSTAAVARAHIWRARHKAQARRSQKAQVTASIRAGIAQTKHHGRSMVGVRAHRVAIVVALAWRRMGAPAAGGRRGLQQWRPRSSHSSGRCCAATRGSGQIKQRRLECLGGGAYQKSIRRTGIGEASVSACCWKGILRRR